MKSTKQPLYNTWLHVRQRCNSSSYRDYKYYGGRGIKVCKRWNIADWKSTGFLNFLKDMGDRPEGYQLDRIDNNKGYSPKNCKWSTPKENLSNTRYNVTYQGEHAFDAGKRLGGNRDLVCKRIKLGWSLERAFTEKARIYNRRDYEYN